MSLPTATTVKLVVGIVCALALALLVHDRNRWKSTATLRQQQVVAEKAAHLATVANYRAAAEQARAADAANAARVRRQQDSINERTADDFETRIAAARARAGQLRLETAGAAADPGAGRAAPVPTLPAAPGRADQAAGQDGLPAPGRRCGPEEGCLGADDALIATEQAIQLDELINWVRAQGAVDPAK